VADAEDLGDLADESFDAAISNFGVIFAPEPSRVLEEIARVLKPGGVFAMSVWIANGAVAETCALINSITPPPPEGASTPESWGEPGMAELRLGSHFDGLERIDVAVPCEYATVDIAWQRMRDGRPPFALAYGRLPLDQKQAVEVEARELFRSHAGPDGWVRYVREAAILRGLRR